MEYAIYPFKDIRITQRHDAGNHLSHWKPTPTPGYDKPWDEGCTDSGKQYFEPMNDFKIVEIIGLDTSSTKGTTNSVRLETVNKVKIPYKNDPVILEMTLTHIDEAELKKYKPGQILKAGGKYLQEGKDGATANHYHCTADYGKYYGMLLNSNGKWCFVYEKSLLPTEAFYIKPNWNKLLDTKGYTFQSVPNNAKDDIKKITTNIRKELDEIDKLLGEI